MPSNVSNCGGIVYRPLVYWQNDQHLISHIYKSVHCHRSDDDHSFARARLLRFQLGCQSSLCININTVAASQWTWKLGWYYSSHHGGELTRNQIRAMSLFICMAVRIGCFNRTDEINWQMRISIYLMTRCSVISRSNWCGGIQRSSWMTTHCMLTNSSHSFCAEEREREIENVLISAGDKTAQMITICYA